MGKGLKIINHFFTLLFFISFGHSFANDNCRGLAQLSVNGDNGHGDNCEFYMDVFRTHRALKKHKCRRILVPTENKELSSNTSECYGYVRRYQKLSDAAGESLNKKTFFNSLDKTVESGTEGTVITLSDHGNKIGMDDCESETECFSDPSRMESQVSMGEDSITASEMRKKIVEINQKQTMLHCQCKNCKCPHVPPLIFNFDHCYSGGMLDSLFDPKTGETMNNVCGLSAADEGEMSYTGENIAKAMNELRIGMSGRYASSYKKYDLDGDNAFSLSEIQRYMAKKTPRSTPLLSSQKYLLNYFNKNNLHLPESSVSEIKIEIPCPLESLEATDEDFYMGALKTELELERRVLEKDTRFITGDNYDFNNDQTLAILESADTRIQKTMDEYLQNENLEIKIMDDLKKITDETIFGKMNNAENEILSNKNRIELINRVICRKNPMCKAIQEKWQDLNSKQWDDSGISDIEKEEMLQLKKEIKVYTDKAMDPCEKVCQKIKKEESKLQQNEKNHEEYTNQYFRNMEKENKLVLKKVKSAFSGIENRFINERPKKKYLRAFAKFHDSISESLSKGNCTLKEIEEDTDNFLTDTLQPMMKPNNDELHKVHLKNVKTRKAINNLKFFQAKRHILKKKDINTLQNYNALKICENEPLIKY